MAEISANDVKRLRDMTGAGMMECKRALQEAGGDLERARMILRERGLADAAKRRGREAKEGLVEAYLHAPTPGVPPRVGVLLELNTETDFTAKTEEVRQLARQLAMHVAAARPLWVAPEDVPEDVLAAERELALKKVEGKPDHVKEKAVEGAVRKYLKQVCLLEQPWFQDEKHTVREVISELAARTGENIGVRRFVRYEVAEALE